MIKKPDTILPLMREGIDGSLVLWFRGQGSRGLSNKILDLIHNGNHGTIVGASWKNSPLNHPVLSFDGIDDKVVVGNASTFAFLHKTNVQWTASFWIKLTTTGSTDVFLTTGLGGGTGTGADIYVTGTPKTFGVMISRGVGASFVSGTITLQGTYPNDNAWHHVVFTWNHALANSNGNYYLDGALVHTLNKTGNTPSADDPSHALSVAGDAGFAAWLTGLMDEVRIYNRVLTMSEIGDVYNLTKQNYGR